MKKLPMFILSVCMMVTFMPALLTAQTASIATVAEPKDVEAENLAKSTALMARLNEIKGMDKSTLTSIEKKQLRKEVKEIKTNLKAATNGVYLSVGAIIIIILLLILLL